MQEHFRISCGIPLHIHIALSRSRRTSQLAILRAVDALSFSLWALEYDHLATCNRSCASSVMKCAVSVHARSIAHRRGVAAPSNCISNPHQSSLQDAPESFAGRRRKRLPCVRRRFWTRGLRGSVATAHARVRASPIALGHDQIRFHKALFGPRLVLPSRNTKVWRSSLRRMTDETATRCSKRRSVSARAAFRKAVSTAVCFMISCAKCYYHQAIDIPLCK